MIRKEISDLRWCYSLAELTISGEHCFLVAAENRDPVELFREDGTKVTTITDWPGGTMTMQQVPGRDGAFMATHRFYSPNEAAEASIVLVEPVGTAGSADKTETGEIGKPEFTVRKILDAPFVHRFGILQRNGVKYLLVCCLKSGQDHEDDWSYPGACYAAVLPDDLSCIDEEHPLKLKCIKDSMLKNHGFYLYQNRFSDSDMALVTCDSGVYEFIPPESEDGEWEINCILPVPASDAVLCDLDSDGQEELAVISPFHGNTLLIYHKDQEGCFTEKTPWVYPEELPMLHAIWAGNLKGTNTLAVGFRRGAMDTLLLRYKDGSTNEYKVSVLDEGVGAANLMHFVNEKGQDVLIASNRETSSTVMYTII